MSNKARLVEELYTDIQHYKEWSWDINDLLQCKQIIISMLINDMDVDIIYSLDFGNLDVDEVIEEFYN